MNDNKKKVKKLSNESGIEYRATIRFPRKDYEFMQDLIKDGEYTNITEIVRDAVKRFRLDWIDQDTAPRFSPMAPWMMDKKMQIMMQRMMRKMNRIEDDEK